MIKKYLFIPAIIMIAVLTAGCARSPGNDSPAPSRDDVSAPSQETASESETPAAPAEQSVTIRIGGLKGPTSMGMVKLLKDAKDGNSLNDYEFTLAGSADELTPRLVTGDLDIAAIPANLASVLYNNTGGQIKLLAINTLGVLYIVEDGNTIENLTDLKDKTIYATGRGAVPELTLNYLLRENGLDPEKDVDIEWKTEPTEVVSLMSAKEGGIAMLPQPYVTVAQGVIENLRIAVDLTREWDALGADSMLITGVLVVRAAFADEHRDQLAAFLEEYRASTEYVKANTADASVLIEEFDIVKAAIAEKALPYCNITYYAGSDMKTAIQGYLQVLFDQNPQSVGGVLPDDDFYYGAR